MDYTQESGDDGAKIIDLSGMELPFEFLMEEKVLPDDHNIQLLTLQKRLNDVKLEIQKLSLYLDELEKYT